jgi:hypothetical protein
MRKAIAQLSISSSKVAGTSTVNGIRWWFSGEDLSKIKSLVENYLKDSKADYANKRATEEAAKKKKQ